MASRLEAATKQFGVPMLFSGPLIQICSKELQSKVRMIDRVTVKGSLHPLDLYTCDVCPENLMPDQQRTSAETQEQRKKKKISQRIAREKFKGKSMDKRLDKPVSRLFETDNEIVLMRRDINSTWIQEFNEAFQHYIKGQWREALTKLDRVKEMRGGFDGPSETLIRFMNEHHGDAPAKWPGYRELTEK